MKRLMEPCTRGLSAAVVAIALMVVVGASGASAHSQTVTPPGQDGPVVQGPISNPWAQAHCNSNAPATVAAASGGVVVFTPAATLPCPPVENPGGQVHP